MDRIVNWLLLIIIFVFDPLAIALVIAANFAFAQITKRKETPESTNEDKEWEETSLQDLQDWYEEEENVPEPNENLKQAFKKYKEQSGVPVMVDPKTGKFSFTVLDFVGLCKRMEDNGKGTKKENSKVVKPGLQPLKSGYFKVQQGSIF